MIRQLALILVWALVSAAALVTGIALLLPRVEAAFDRPPPPIPEPRTAFFDLLRDARPVSLVVTEAWQKVPIVVETDDLLRDPTLWNRLHFDDWDRVPEPLRRAALERMIARYQPQLAGPDVWEAMTAEDWDFVPQPLRAMAFIRISEYWAEYYGIGVGSGLGPRDTAATFATILMVESWFEHRAVHVDENGNRDLGLPQASDYMRVRLEHLHRARWLDFRLEERDYFNPWLAILAGAVWFDLMIKEARGDLDLAARAYRKGIFAANHGAAEEYLHNVKQKRDLYILNRAAPPTWSFLSRRLRGRARVRRAAGRPLYASRVPPRGLRKRIGSGDSRGLQSRPGPG